MAMPTDWGGLINHLRNKQAEGNSVCCQLAVWWDSGRERSWGFEPSPVTHMLHVSLDGHYPTERRARKVTESPATKDTSVTVQTH